MVTLGPSTPPAVRRGENLESVAFSVMGKAGKSKSDLLLLKDPDDLLDKYLRLKVPHGIPITSHKFYHTFMQSLLQF